MLEEIAVRPKLPRQAGPLAKLLPLVLILWCFVGIYLLQLRIDRAGEVSQRAKLMEELTYFPSGRFVRQAAIEYRQLAADFIWLRAIQYYGYHLMTDRRYEWLGHVFAILTTLDEQFIGAYHFGAYTLAWDARKPHEAIDLLVAGMKLNPLDWQLPFDAGFICFTVLKDYETAGWFFDVASRLPNTWVITGRWAAIATAKAGDFRTAREMWVEIYKSTGNKAIKALVIRQLRSLKLDEGIDQIQKAVRRFRDTERRLPADLRELVRMGYLERIPEEPYGGHYLLDGDKVRTSTPPGTRDEAGSSGPE